MSKLIALGCSLTYGHGLPDCHISPNFPGLKPSSMGWPNILGAKMGKDTVNLGICGASNLNILWQLLNYKFEENDFCVVIWSFFNRIDVRKIQKDPSMLGKLYDDEMYKNIILEEGYQFHTAVRNYMIFQHAGLYLESKKIPYYFVVLDGYEFKIPDPLLVKNLHRPIRKPLLVDKALDNSHPGIQSHKKISEYLYEKIKEVYN